MDMILDPTVLFFCLGVLAVWFRSNIEIPAPTMKFLSYYLLMSIGFKGGVALAKTTWTPEMGWTVVAGLMASALIPCWMFFVLKRRISSENAAAVAACYGSVSAVTFLTSISWLENHNETFGGHFVALMALMESPAIIVGILLAKLSATGKETQFSLKSILHDAFFNGSIFLLVGSMFIGFLMNPNRAHDYQTFIYDIFKGFLCFFLLDLGMTAARQVRELRNNALFLGMMALVSPLINGTLGLLISRLIGLGPSDSFLLMVLLASASYIAVPAALRTSLPNAQPSLYLSMGLGITFPFNILIGLPIYWWVAHNWI